MLWKMWKIGVFSIIILAFGISSVTSQREQARCFQFTWLGPSFHNGSVFENATCSEVTRLASGVPCFQPLVVSYDGSRPDVDYIWTHHATQASCVLADTDVCATYSYFFNGLIMNTTHMCTRVEESAGRSVTGGCFETSSGNFRTRACFCRSVPGGVPCNAAGGARAAHTLLLFLLPILLFVARFENWSFG